VPDDDAVARLSLSRRAILGLLGWAGAAWVMRRGGGPARAAAAPSCVVRPEQTEGPYFIDERLERPDIRSDPASGAVKAGVPLALTLVVSRVGKGACEPLAGARVDLWQCDAQGVYSDVEDRRFNTVGQRFLRGYQVTDRGGEARFLTIYPGWYPGRTVHIHFKIRTDPTAARGLAFTSQLYFDDALTDRVHTASPYAGRGQRSTRNQDDGIFRRGGRELLLAPVRSAEGYKATFPIGFATPGSE